MPQSSIILFYLIAGFLVFVISKGEFSTYVGFLTGGTTGGGTVAAPSLGGLAGSNTQGNSSANGPVDSGTFDDVSGEPALDTGTF